MSYILDALRKADAERERDPARGIHAQPAVLPAESSRFPSWLPMAAAAIAVLAAGAAWLMRPAASPVAPAAVPLAAAPVASPARQAPLPAAPQVVQVAATVSPPAPAPLPVPERAPAKPVVQVAKAAAAAKPAASAAPVASAAASAAPAAAPAAAVAAPAAPAVQRILTAAELPADVQQSLPKLQISGGVYSENAAQRMLIVGGQVMNEGAQIAPGAVLEQIKPHTAILKFRGYRYSVAY